MRILPFLISSITLSGATGAAPTARGKFILTRRDRFSHFELVAPNRLNYHQIVRIIYSKNRNDLKSFRVFPRIFEQCF